MAVYDELASGIAPAGAPSIALSAGAIGFAVFAIPALVGLIEAPLILRAGRAPRRWLVGAFLVMAVACFLGAMSTGWLLALALSIYAPGSGVACALAESELVGRSGARGERAMARWTIAGSIGDLLSLLLISVAALGSLGIRAAFAACGILALGQALVLRRVPLAVPLTASDERPAALPWKNRRLLGWTVGLAFCGLLDEVVIAFGALYLADGLGAGVHARTFILGAWMTGGFAGLALLERVASRVRPSLLLQVASAGSAILFVAWVFAGSVPVSAGLAFPAGACSAMLYPLAKARAYASLPGRPAAVNALGSLLSPLEWVVLPIVIGLTAEWLGLVAAMLALAVQPVLLLVLTLRDRS